jgi:hypothetical protein
MHSILQVSDWALVVFDQRTEAFFPLVFATAIPHKGQAWFRVGV